MTSMMGLTITTGPPVARRPSSITSEVGPGQRTIRWLPTSSKTCGSRLSVVVRSAKQIDDGDTYKNVVWAYPAQQYDPRKMMTPLETSHIETPSWAMKDKGETVEMWFSMPGITVKDIQVYVKDQKLFIQGKDDTSPLKRIMLKHFERIQLPTNCRKEDITAKLKNGILTVFVPKASRPESPYEVPIETVSW